MGVGGGVCVRVSWTCPGAWVCEGGEGLQDVYLSM